MVQSMTAFARSNQQFDWGELTWELRSVNHRYLDVSLKLPEHLRELEPLAREVARKSLKRGKLDASLKWSINQSTQTQISINAATLNALLGALNTIKDQNPQLSTPNTLEVLAWPGMIQDHNVAVKTVQGGAMDLFKTAIDDLIQQRQREGQALAQFILDHLTTVSEIVGRVKTAMPELLAKQRQSLIDRFNELQLHLDPDRLEQEFAIIVNKTDVQEEIERLQTHIQETQRVLSHGGGIGRQLDFIMQEFNREANTLSSKAVDMSVTQAAIELKVLIEQMREQVQNIE